MRARCDRHAVFGCKRLDQAAHASVPDEEHAPFDAHPATSTLKHAACSRCIAAGTSSSFSTTVTFRREAACDTIFSGNQVVRIGAAADSADVVLAGKTLVVDGNRVRESGRLSMEIKADKENYTVLGNICNGIIRVNGATVIAPWAALNRQSI